MSDGRRSRLFKRARRSLAQRSRGPSEREGFLTIEEVEREMDELIEATVRDRPSETAASPPP